MNIFVFLLSSLVTILLGIYVNAELVPNIIIVLIIVYSLSYNTIAKLNSTRGNQVSIMFSLYPILYCLFILSYNSSVTAGNELNPFMPGGDAVRYFQQGQSLIRHISFEYLLNLKTNYVGYQLVIAVISLFPGNSFFNILSFNYIVVVLISITVIKIVRYIYRGDNTKILESVALISFFIPQLISYSILTLKDPLIVFLSLVYIVHILKVIDGNRLFSAYLITGISILMLSFLRIPIVFFLVLLTIALNTKRRMKSVGLLLAILLLLTLFSGYIFSFTSYAFDFDYFEGKVLSNAILGNNQSSSNSGVISALGNYENIPMYRKLLLLPVSLVIQFITPFHFWKMDLISHHIYYINNQINLIWLLYTGPLFILTITNMRFIKNTRVRRLFLFGLVGYILIAFSYGGVIPRYALLFIFLMIPGVAIIYSKYREENKILKYFLNYYLFLSFLVLSYIIFSIV
jgi:hypothetical protein